MDIGKAFGASKLAVILIFFVAIIRSLLLFLLPTISQESELFWMFSVCMIVPVIFVVDILLYLWLGQLIYKDLKLGIVDAVVVGGLTGAVDGIITGVILMVANLLGIGLSIGGVGTGSFTTAIYGLQLSFIAAILITIILFFIGLILSAIGYMVGGVKRK